MIRTFVDVDDVVVDGVVVDGGFNRSYASRNLSCEAVRELVRREAKCRIDCGVVPVVRPFLCVRHMLSCTHLEFDDIFWFFWPRIARYEVRPTVWRHFRWCIEFWDIFFHENACCCECCRVFCYLYVYFHLVSSHVAVKRYWWFLLLVIQRRQNPFAICIRVFVCFEIFVLSQMVLFYTCFSTSVLYLGQYWDDVE